MSSLPRQSSQVNLFFRAPLTKSFQTRSLVPNPSCFPAWRRTRMNIHLLTAGVVELDYESLSFKCPSILLLSLPSSAPPCPPTPCGERCLKLSDWVPSSVSTFSAHPGNLPRSQAAWKSLKLLGGASLLGSSAGWELCKWKLLRNVGTTKGIQKDCVFIVWRAICLKIRFVSLPFSETMPNIFGFAIFLISWLSAHF